MVESVRLFHVSDLHFGREDRAALDWFARTVAAERPAAVVITGDFTFRARSDEFAAAVAYLGTLAAPLSLEPGNHDLPYYSDPLRRLFRPYRRFARFEAAIEKPLSLPGVTVIPLRTVSRLQFRLNQSLGIVRPKALARAVSEIADLPQGNVPLIACHHPLVDIAEMAEPQRTRFGASALAALARVGARAVLTGHVHDPFDRQWRLDESTIRLIGAGTLSERVRLTPPSFNEIRITGGQIDNRVRTMTG
jgi:3',5'-cyclic AMP phosphodiesterase CpdA